MEPTNAIDPAKYLPLVKSIVDRLDVTIPNYWDRDDVIGYGIIGLLEARERFKADRGVHFATFASQRIRGSILDALRSASPLSRNCWQKIQKITGAMEQISAASGREASLEEIVQAVKMERNEVEDALQSFRLMASISLEQTLGFDELMVKDTLKAPEESSPEEAFLQAERVRLLSAAIESLEQRQRLVLTLYYYEDLGLQEIAEVLEISVSRVSQLKTVALAALRRRMQEDSDL